MILGDKYDNVLNWWFFFPTDPTT